MTGLETCKFFNCSILHNLQITIYESDGSSDKPSARLLGLPGIAKSKAYRKTTEKILIQEFVGFLSTFSRRATLEDQLRFLFSVHDMDGDGTLSKDDLELMLRQLAGSSLS